MKKIRSLYLEDSKAQSPKYRDSVRGTNPTLPLHVQVRDNEEQDTNVEGRRVKEGERQTREKEGSWIPWVFSLKKK